MKDKIYPDLSIVLMGHVDHGKTTLAKALTGKWLSKHSEELKRGITIKLGYADFTIYKKDDKLTVEKCEDCEPIRKISIVDAPGHEALITTMITGAALVDVGVLVIAANEPVPQPQTKEHLIAFKLLGSKPLIVVQNKIDLVSEEKAVKNYEEIRKFLENYGYNPDEIPIIPISAIHGINVEYLLEALVDIPLPKRDLEKEPIFLVSRSFDVNKPGTPIERLVGGVLGGSLIRGRIKTGDKIEIRPGLFINNQWVPIKTKVISLKQGGYDVEEIRPGGTAGIQTSLDPFITKDDTLSGQIVGLEGKLPKQMGEIEIEYKLFEKVIGEKEEIKVERIKIGENLMVAVYNIVSTGIVRDINKDYMRIKLTKPVLGEKGDKVILGRKIRNRWRIIGYGKLL